MKTNPSMLATTLPSIPETGDADGLSPPPLKREKRKSRPILKKLVLPAEGGVVDREELERFKSQHTVVLPKPPMNRFVESVEEWALRGVMEQVETDDHLFFKLGPTTQHYATASIYDKTHPAVYIGVVDRGQLSEGCDRVVKYPQWSKITLTLSEFEQVRSKAQYLRAIGDEMGQGGNAAGTETSFSTSKDVSVRVSLADDGNVTFQISRLTKTILGVARTNQYESVNLSKLELDHLVRDYFEGIVNGMEKVLTHRALFSKTDDPPDMDIVLPYVAKLLAHNISPKISAALPGLLPRGAETGDGRELIRGEAVHQLRLLSAGDIHRLCGNWARGPDEQKIAVPKATWPYLLAHLATATGAPIVYNYILENYALLCSASDSSVCSEFCQSE